MRKKLGSEKKYQLRHVWLDTDSGDFYWSKEPRNKINGTVKPKLVNIKSNAVVNVVKTKWTAEECCISILLAGGTSVSGSSRSLLGGSGDRSIDLSLLPSLYNVQPAYAVTLMQKNAELLYSALEELVK